MRAIGLSGGAALLAGALFPAISSAQPEPPAPRPSATQPDESTAPKPRVIGTILPPLTLSTRTDVWWTAPSAPLTVALGAGAASGRRSTQVVGRWLAQGSWRWFTVDALLHTPPEPRPDEPTAPNARLATGTTAWTGLRIRLAEAEDELVVFGLYGRAGLPITPDSRLRSDFGLALGGAVSSWTWLFNFGSRQRHDDFARSAPDLVNPYMMLGPAWNPSEDLRLFAMGSFQGLVEGLTPIEEVATLYFAGHAHLGAEVHVGPLLVAPSLMLSPLQRPREPHASVQLWLGYVP